MAKVPLTDLVNTYDVTAINANFAKIEAAFEDEVLFRDNPSGVNTLEGDIDVNGKKLYNLPAPTLNSQAARLQDVQNALAGGDANLITFTQAGTGAVQTNLQNKARQEYNVFDVMTDAEIADSSLALPTLDTTAKIQLAIDNALALGQKVVAYGTFRISSKLVFKGDADFSSAKINVYSAPAIALEVSTGVLANPTTVLNNATVWLPKVVANMTKPGTGWAGQGVGVRLVNTSSCTIFVGDMVNFATNLLVTSYSAGNVYNNIFLSHLENGQVNLALTPGDVGAWVNENNFFGGRFSHYSAEGTNVAGTRHISIPKTTGNVQNNNLFVKPSIEGNTAEYHVENCGSYNTIQQGRWEAATPKIFYDSDNTSQATRNFISGGYNVAGIVYTYAGVGGGNNLTIFPGGGFETINRPIGYQNQGSSNNAIQYFYEAGTRPETAAANDWSVFHGSSSLQGKRKADLYYRLKLDYQNGRIYFDNGTTAAPTAYIASYGANDIALTGCNWKTSADVSQTLGTTALRWAGTFSGYLQTSTAAVSGAAGTVTIGGTTAATVGAAGGASALPATPLGYINIFVAGVAAKIPYYTA